MTSYQPRHHAPADAAERHYFFIRHIDRCVGFWRWQYKHYSLDVPGPGALPNKTTPGPGHQPHDATEDM